MVSDVGGAPDSLSGLEAVKRHAARLGGLTSGLDGAVGAPPARPWGADVEQRVSPQYPAARRRRMRRIGVVLATSAAVATAAPATAAARHRPAGRDAGDRQRRTPCRPGRSTASSGRRSLVGNTVYATGNFTRARPPGSPAGSQRGGPQQPARVRHHHRQPGHLVQPHPQRAGPGRHRLARTAPGSTSAATSPPSTARPAVTDRRLRHRHRRAGRQLRARASAARCGRSRATDTHRLRRRRLLQRRRCGAATRLAAFDARQRRRCCPGRRRPTTHGRAPWCWRRTAVPGRSSAASSPRSTAPRAYGMGAVDATTGAIAAVGGQPDDPGRRRHRRDHSPVDRRHADLRRRLRLRLGRRSFEGTLRREPRHRRHRLAERLPRRHLRRRSRSGTCSTASATRTTARWIGGFPGGEPARVAGSTRWPSTTYPTGVNRGPDNYSWNYSGQPAPHALLALVPDAGRSAPSPGRARPAWSVTGNAQYVVARRRVPAGERRRPAGPDPVRGPGARAEPARAGVLGQPDPDRGFAVARHRAGGLAGDARPGQQQR